MPLLLLLLPVPLGVWPSTPRVRVLQRRVPGPPTCIRCSCTTGTTCVGSEVGVGCSERLVGRVCSRRGTRGAPCVLRRPAVRPAAVHATAVRESLPGGTDAPGCKWGQGHRLGCASGGVAVLGAAADVRVPACVMGERKMLLLLLPRPRTTQPSSARRRHTTIAHVLGWEGAFKVTRQLCWCRFSCWHLPQGYGVKWARGRCSRLSCSPRALGRWASSIRWWWAEAAARGGWG